MLNKLLEMDEDVRTYGLIASFLVTFFFVIIFMLDYPWLIVFPFLFLFLLFYTNNKAEKLKQNKENESI